MTTKNLGYSLLRSELAHTFPKQMQQVNHLQCSSDHNVAGLVNSSNDYQLLEKIQKQYGHTAITRVHTVFR